MRENITFALALSACLVSQRAAFTQNDSASLRITRGFHSPPLLQKTVKLKGQSVMDILKQNAEVETAFGGAFVTAINGIKSASGINWFYYINGSMANVGAGLYIPGNGDCIHWDLHRWRKAWPVTNIIGDYPQPFKSAALDGGKITIAYSEGMEPDAGKLLAAMRERVAKTAVASPLAAVKEGGINLFIGPWPRLKEVPAIAELYKNRYKTGCFLEFKEDGLHALDISGRMAEKFEKAGAIFALGACFSSEPPVWIVTGTDLETAGSAASVLINTPEKILGLVAAVVEEDRVISVPFNGGR